MSEETSKCHKILLIEDNPGDIGLIRRALARSVPQADLRVAHDGPEALAYLAEEHAAGAGLPDLILLDLSLPKMDGCEVLTHIRGEAWLFATPVVVLSSSQAEQDVLRSYAHRANCFVTKPLDLDQYMAVIRSVQHFWLAGAKLPRNNTHG
jgi:CheY-like chemotaxis protein